MSRSTLLAQVADAVSAAESKKAEDIAILQLDKGAFTDYLVLCHGSNPRQVQAIADEVELRLKRNGVRPNSVEGYTRAEWVLLDYVDFVVEIFDEARRRFYDLDRLWKSARRLALTDLKRGRTAAASRNGGSRRTVATKTIKRRAATRKAASKTARPRKAVSRKKKK